MKKIVLAYSGGLDTSVCVKFLQEKYDAEIITVTLDVGQNDDFEKIEKISKSIGSKKHYFIDAKKEFVENYIFKSIMANGLYQNQYPLGTALSRPLIAKKLVEIASKEDAKIVSHGCTGKGNDQVRFDTTIQYLNPKLEILAPVREWNLSRDIEEKYAKDHGIPIETKQTEYSIDENIWGRCVEGGKLSNLENETGEDIYNWIQPIDKTPDKATYLDIEFQNGVPISINKKNMTSVELIKKLNKIAGINGVGFIDHIEDRIMGIKTREIYECPAAICLITAHKDLENLVLTREQILFKTIISEKWSWLVYSGLWIDDLRSDLEKFIFNTQKNVSGTIKIKLHKGNIKVINRISKFSRYNLNMASYNQESKFDQKDANGFIKIWGLASLQNQGPKNQP